MRENKFTEGEWTLEQWGDTNVICANGKRIGRLYSDDDFSLVRSAKELLQSVEMLMVAIDYQRTDIDSDVRSFVSATIAKAYGESP